jgi:hypothetical protein
MPRFFAPADEPTDWQGLLAKPDLHWKTGYLGWAVGNAEYLTR